MLGGPGPLRGACRAPSDRRLQLSSTRLLFTTHNIHIQHALAYVRTIAYVIYTVPRIGTRTCRSCLRTRTVPRVCPLSFEARRGLARAGAVLLREAAQLALDALAEQLVAGVRVPAVAPASKVALLGEGAARLGRASHGGEERVVHEAERVGGRRLRVRLDARPDGDGGVDGGEVGGDGVVPVPTGKVPGKFREGSR